MSRLVAIALLLAACGRSVDQFPVGVGGGGGVGGNGTGPDAASGTSDADGGATLSGRVCLIADARNPLVCAGSGAMGIKVNLGTSTTMTTDAAGHFTIATPPGTNLYWRVDASTAIVASAIAFSADNTIPVLGRTLYSEMASANNTAFNDGTGTIIAKLTRGGTALSGAIVTPTPAPNGLVFYDGASATDWQAQQTSTFGVVWVPGMTPTTAHLSITGTATGTVANIPVFGDGITFVFAEIP